MCTTGVYIRRRVPEPALGAVEASVPLALVLRGERFVLICFVQGEVVAGRVVREGDVRVGGRRGSAQLIVRWNKFSSTP